MSVERHLILQEVILRPSGEWAPEGRGWTIARVAEGGGYWMREALPARGENGIQPGGNARALNTGDGLVLACGACRVSCDGKTSSPGLLRASQLGPLKLHYFTVQPQFLNGLLTVSEWHQLEAVAEGAVLNFTSVEPIGQKFAHIANQTHSEGLTTRCALLQLWAGAVTGMFPASHAAAGANRLRDRFRQFIGQMLEAELSGKTLGELAEQLHCSERHFSRLFREEFGVPLRARQIELRLQRARQLLADSDAKIINVAYDSGYRHLGLFNAMFKRRFGVTPSEWRRKGGAQKPAAARAGDRKKIQPRMDTNPAKRGGLKTWFPPRNNF
jgi:AraC-like DNA-binding protein